MAKERQKISKEWRDIIIFIIIFVIIVLGIITYFKYRNIFDSKIDWDTLDYYDDSLTSCFLQANSLMNNGKYEATQNQLIICQSTINEALVKINAWGREDSSDEIKVAKIDYQAGSYSLSAINLLLDVKLGNFDSPKDVLDKLNQANILIAKTLSDINQIKSLYSKTEYYKRYYESKKEEMDESYKNAQNLKTRIQQTLDYYNSLECESGYVLGEDYQCYPQCGSETEYCETGGQCCNGNCYSCPVGYYLAVDCKCYPN